MDRDLIFIRDVLRKHLSSEHHRAYLFGSRARGQAQRFSDYDIFIEGKPLSAELYFEIISTFEDSDFPYKVDIVRKEDLSPDFLKVASLDMIPIPLERDESYENESTP